MKWGITAANINDFTRPVEGISYPQQCGKQLFLSEETCKMKRQLVCERVERRATGILLIYLHA